jgi:thiosulfate dehydrogenase [quinone] large subunit
VARAGLLGLLAVQALLGYEWLMSGITKVVRGGFPSGLADELREKSEGAASWYSSFLDGVVIPNGSLFGVLIILGELFVGIALIVAAGLWAFRWHKLGPRGRTGLLATTVAAGVGGILMNVNFHLANGFAHPWLIPGDGFDEGVDLDSFMPAVQLVLVVVAISVWRTMRQRTAAADQLLRNVAAAPPAAARPASPDSRA